MADAKKVEISNPHVSLIAEDLTNRSKWEQIDEEVLKSRLCERDIGNLPYPNAPAFIEPIIDDNVRTKTSQEYAMLSNAPKVASPIPLDENADQQLIQKAAVGFDTYFKYIISGMRRVEQGLDTRNERGFCVYRVYRKEYDRWGECPDFEVIDNRDCIVPTSTAYIEDALRITIVFRKHPDEVRKMAKKRGWQNYEEVIEKVTQSGREGGAYSVADAYEKVKHLVGITTSGDSNSTVVLWECWHYATEWDLQWARPGVDIEVGEKCCLVFSPDYPDKPLICYPWREDDVIEPLNDEEKLMELVKAVSEGREAILHKMVKGATRRWPIIQCRYENRSAYFLDSRGVGILTMDDQLAASDTKNAKMTMCDFVMRPMLKGTAPQDTQNITFEAGSFLPKDADWAQPPQISQQFDFDIESSRRNASRRIGTTAQTQYNDQPTRGSKEVKTATQVTDDRMNTQMLSNVDVDRFNWGFMDLFQQLWDDLRRMRKPIPMIENGKFIGKLGGDVYSLDLLMVPASSAKTWSPDIQLQKAMTVYNFMASAAAQNGVTFDPQKAIDDILSFWDPQIKDRWLFDPKAANGTMPPVYMLLQQLQEQIQATQNAVKATGEMAMKSEENLEKVMRPMEVQS